MNMVRLLRFFISSVLSLFWPPLIAFWKAHFGAVDRECSFGQPRQNLQPEAFCQKCKYCVNKKSFKNVAVALFWARALGTSMFLIPAMAEAATSHLGTNF